MSISTGGGGWACTKSTSTLGGAGVLSTFGGGVCAKKKSVLFHSTLEGLF